MEFCHKIHLNNWTWAGKFVRREKEGEKTEKKNQKEEVKSSPLREVCANPQSFQMTG